MSKVLSLKLKDESYIKSWNARQVYIALGVLLETAAILKVDACPMEGFDNAQFDKILGLDKMGYSSVAMTALGYRSETDDYAKLEKARFSKEEVFKMV